MYKTLMNYFIGDILRKTDDYYEKAKFKLIFNFTTILILLVAPTSLLLLFTGLYMNALIGLASLGTLLVVNYVMKYTESIQPAAQIYIFTALITISTTYLPAIDSNASSNDLWSMIIILFTYFALGSRWTLLIVVICIIEQMIYYKFLFYDDMHNELAYTEEQIIAALLVTPIVFLAIFYLLRQFVDVHNHAKKMVSEQNTLLSEQNSLIERQRDEKSAMIKEIHHRVKNNLQTVNSLLRLQSSSLKNKKAIIMFENAQKRVLSMALLHESMYKSENLGEIDFQKHFKLLIDDLIQSYNNGKLIESKVEIGELKIGMKTMVPLGLIINELITNSLKYAFNQRDEGKITVALHHLNDLKHELIIGDDGVGSPLDINTNNENFSGLELVRIFVEQMDGTIVRMDQPGTFYRIEFYSLDR